MSRVITGALMTTTGSYFFGLGLNLCKHNFIEIGFCMSIASFMSICFGVRLFIDSMIECECE